MTTFVIKHFCIPPPYSHPPHLLAAAHFQWSTTYKGGAQGVCLCNPSLPPHKYLTPTHPLPHVYTPPPHITASATGSERTDFLHEIDTMKKIAKGNNPHVVGLVGCVTIQEPLCLITEFVKHGDLLSYLQNIRKLVHRLITIHYTINYYNLLKIFLNQKWTLYLNIQSCSKVLCIAT